MEAPTKLDLAALIISASALYLAVMQGEETRESNRIAVRPHLDISYIAANGIPDPHGFKVDNGGLGPAIIDEMTVFVNGKEAHPQKDKMWFAAIEKVGWPVTDRKEFNPLYLPKGSILKSERELYLLKLLPSTGKNKRELTFDEWKMLRQISIELKYRSFQGEECSIRYVPMDEQPYQRKSCQKN